MLAKSYKKTTPNQFEDAFRSSGYLKQVRAARDSLRSKSHYRNEIIDDEILLYQVLNQDKSYKVIRWKDYISMRDIGFDLKKRYQYLRFNGIALESTDFWNMVEDLSRFIDDHHQSGKINYMSSELKISYEYISTDKPYIKRVRESHQEVNFEKNGLEYESKLSICSMNISQFIVKLDENKIYRHNHIPLMEDLRLMYP